MSKQLVLSLVLKFDIVFILVILVLLKFKQYFKKMIYSNIVLRVFKNIKIIFEIIKTSLKMYLMK